MKSYLTFEPGVPELKEFAPHCWVHVECPDEDDFIFLTKNWGSHESFYLTLPTSMSVHVQSARMIGY